MIFSDYTIHGYMTAKAELDELEAKITLMKAKADKATAETRIRYERQVEELRRKYDQSKKRLNEFIESSQVGWEEIQSGVDKAMQDLRTSVNSAANQILE